MGSKTAVVINVKSPKSHRRFMENTATFSLSFASLYHKLVVIFVIVWIVRPRRSPVRV